MALLIIYLLGALLISFLCSILEATLMSSPISFITMREDEGYKPAKLMKQYKLDSSRPIAAILALNTIANTIGAAGVGKQATLVFGSQWFGLVSALMTLLILIFSEIIPKTIGTSHWKSLMGFAAKAIRLLIIVLFPIVWCVEKSKNGSHPRPPRPPSPVKRWAPWPMSRKSPANWTKMRMRSSRT